MHEQVGKYRASDKKMRQGRACVNGLKQAIFAVYLLTGPVYEGVCPYPMGIWIRTVYEGVCSFRSIQDEGLIGMRYTK